MLIARVMVTMQIIVVERKMLGGLVVDHTAGSTLLSEPNQNSVRVTHDIIFLLAVTEQCNVLLMCNM